MDTYNGDKIITIDGPSGAGKGTVSAAIASKFSCDVLDSGALYRTLVFELKKKTDIDKQEDINDDIINCIVDIINSLDVSFVFDKKKNILVLSNGNDISNEIRKEYYGLTAAKFAKNPLVRQAMLLKQRGFAKPNKILVADGRDMGTVVFSKAKYKFFITADIKIRVKRRYKQLQDKINASKITSILESISDRDKLDTNRTSSPLIPADDAVIIDTSNMSITKVVGEVLQHINFFNKL